MKKIIIIAIAAMFIFGLSSTSFAHRYSKSGGSNYTTIVGKVVSVNQEKHSFVLECNELGTKSTVFVQPDQISLLNAGDIVKVTLPQGSNMARKIISR